MKRLLHALLPGFFLALGTLNCSLAQSPETTFSTQSFWQPAGDVFSPQVLQSGQVTFRIKAKQAKAVHLLFGEWNIKPQLLTKKSDEVWEITIGPVAPGIYSYLFSVDGTPTIDIANPRVKRGTEVYGNIVEVISKTPDFDQWQAVPHGVLQQVRYFSTAQQRPATMMIYLPPHYFSQPEKQFPLLCLRHGGGDNETSWTQEAGRADAILDNLLHRQKAIPMIMVMPYGLTDGSWAGGSNKQGMEVLEKELMEDILPYMEKNYRLLPGRESRAIAGLSMGGGQAYVMGLKNLDTFAWIGEFSSGLLSDPAFDINERAPGVFNNAAAVNQKIRLLWIGCGTDDPRIDGHKKLVSELSQKGIKHKVLNIPGGHEWKVWRIQLHEFLQQLFK